jgi:hypothetical protein
VEISLSRRLSRCKSSGLIRAPEVSSRFGEPRLERDSRRSMEHCAGSQGKTARWGGVTRSCFNPLKRSVRGVEDRGLGSPTDAARGGNGV